MQEEYRPVIEDALKLTRSKFGDRLRSIVLTGSIAFDEALIGASDVDWFAFLDYEPNESDRIWQTETKAYLEKTYPIISEFGLGLYSVDRLRNEESWRFIIKHNSIILYGNNIIDDLEIEGINTPSPTSEMFRFRADWIESHFNDARKGYIRDQLFKTPDNPAFASRKIARYFVGVEAAYLLMKDNHFISFRFHDVINQLRYNYPQWEDVYTMTEMIVNDPINSGISSEHLVAVIDPFIQWMIERLRES
ncbi:MAG: hypothetical protein ACYC27_08525 [Armatimonadota bacterium]